MNHETLVVRASCPLDMYLITPGSAVFIGVWSGKRENRDGYWLRWWDKQGNLLLWGFESVEQERREKEQERREKEVALQRLADLEKRLRDAGIEV